MYFEDKTGKVYLNILRVWLRVHTSCCHSLEGDTASPAVTRSGRIVKSALVASTEGLKVVRTAAVKTGCLCVSSWDRCVKQTTSEKSFGCQEITIWAFCCVLFSIRMLTNYSKTINCMTSWNFPQNDNSTTWLYIFSLYIFIYNTFFFNAR